MDIEWDEAKRISNLAKHGVDFLDVVRFDFATAIIRADTRFHYGEVRLMATGLIASRLHMLIYTIERRAVRVISLRIASRKESQNYVNERTAEGFS